MWKTIKEQPEKTFLNQIWNYYKPIIRGGTTKQSRSYTDRTCIGYEIAALRSQ
jgi:hypothetical protein